MSTPQPAAVPVELTYTLSDKELVDGLTVQQRVARRPWYLRRSMLRLLVVGGVLVYFVLRGLYEGLPVPAIVIPSVVLVVLAGIVFAVMRPLDPARLTRRLTVRHVMRGNPAFTEPIVCTVSPAGVRVRTDRAEATYGWTQYPYHAETDCVFALLASDRVGAAVLTLPKRALNADQVESLRTLLAEHTRRLD